MADPNLTIYIAVRELQEQINAQQRYIAEIDGLFRAMFAENSLWGWAARKLLGDYIKKNILPSVEMIRPIDIPPVLPGTLEVITDDIPEIPAQRRRRRAVNARILDETE